MPVQAADKWQRNRREIMRFAGRYLRTQMRNELRRGVTRTYNRGKGEYRRVTTRFTSAEYDTLHFVAASLRVSVSSLIYGLIHLWQKPSRRTIRRFFASNCACEAGKWDPEAGFIDEFVVFWRMGSNIPPNPLSWQTHDSGPAN
ncbi:MAG: hypothetical protein ACOY5B_17340 [Spirochaetota bacterium]